MVSVEGYTIYITRKNTAVLSFEFVDENGNPYELKDGETAYFTARRYLDGDIKIMKQIVGGQCVLTATETDLNAAGYIYDVTIVAENEVITVVPYSRLLILDEVY